MNKILMSMSVLGLSIASACSNGGPQGPDELDVSESALTSVYRYRWNGVAASGYAYGNYDSLYFDVSEDKTNRSRTASLSFYGWGYDPASEVCQTEQWCYYDEQNQEICEDYNYCYYADYHYTYGWGQIPNDAFRVGGNLKGAELSVDLANAPGFSAMRCQYSDWTCAPITSGTIDVTWTSNGAYSSSSNGTSTTTYGSYSEKSTGQSSSVSADVSGTVLGLDASGSGSLSKSKGNGVSRDISGGGTGGSGGFGGMAGVGGIGGYGGFSGTGGVGGGVDGGV